MRLEPALKAAREESLDAAVLDINLAGERVYHIAQVLAERNIPFVFATGYHRSMLPREHAGRPTLTKPYSPEQLIDQLLALVCASRGAKQALDRSPSPAGLSFPHRRRRAFDAAIILPEVEPRYR